MPFTSLADHFFTSNFAHAFCWMLIHSLWQGLLFTIFTGVVMMVTSKSSPALRYNILAVLFFLFFAVCISTFIWELSNTDEQINAYRSLSTEVAAVNTVNGIIEKFTGYFSTNAPLIMTIWFAVFLVKCVKMMAGLVYIKRLRYRKTNAVPVYWKNKLATLSHQLQVRKAVQLLESGMVKVPVVIGYLKPIILIPAGLLNHLPAGEIEAVLLHELAHIRRHDYFINMIQVFAESIFFFNPALLWLSALLREERENCCDDIALEQTQSKKQFIQALISFKEHELYTNSYTIAFPGKKNLLLQRVSRILNNRNKTLNPFERIFIAASFVILIMVSVTAACYDVALITKTKLQTDTSQLNQVTGIKTAPYETGKKIKIDSIERYAINDKIGQDNMAANIQLNDAAVNEKHFVIEYYNKTITGNDNESPEMGEQLPKSTVTPFLIQAEKVQMDKEQSAKAKEQADEDTKQAELDEIQAKKDMEQAMIDMKQAESDQRQAVIDQQNAEKEKGKSH